MLSGGVYIVITTWARLQMFFYYLETHSMKKAKKKKKGGGSEDLKHNVSLLKICSSLVVTNFLSLKISAVSIY